MRSIYSLLVVLLVFVQCAKAQSYMKKVSDDSNASLTMNVNTYNYSYDNGDYYGRTYTATPQPFVGDGYSETELYNHKVMWNSTQWEFTSQSGTDVNTNKIRATNSIAVQGDGVYTDNYNNYFYNFAKYPACEGWTEGLKMTGLCRQAVKIFSSGSIGSYDATIIPTLRVYSGGNAQTTMSNGKPVYEATAPNGDMLRFIYDGDPQRWQFQKFVITGGRVAVPGGRTADEWQTIATNDSDTPLVPDSGWIVIGGGTLSLNGTTSPLPVTLVKFDVKAQDNKSVKIVWETTEEINAAYFAVERSRDMKTFTEIARVETAANSSVRKTYSVIDDSPAFGTNYYRLRQVDLDNKNQLFRVATAVVSDKDQPFGAFPNPAESKQFYLKVENENEAKVQVFDILGRSLQVTVEKEGDNILAVKPYASLSPGMYMARVTNISGTYTHKVLIR